LKTRSRSPTESAWLSATPEDFRFVVKAQRGGSIRAFGTAAAETVAWLTAPYRLFGERLGGVLYRLPDSVHRSDHPLRALLEAWPADMPLVLEFQHPSWHRRRGVRACWRTTCQLVRDRPRRERST
jgi:uncharacterized protein YecE (DUF72 family)